MKLEKSGNSRKLENTRKLRKVVMCLTRRFEKTKKVRENLKLNNWEIMENRENSSRRENANTPKPLELTRFRWRAKWPLELARLRWGGRYRCSGLLRGPRCSARLRCSSSLGRRDVRKNYRNRYARVGPCCSS